MRYSLAVALFVLALMHLSTTAVDAQAGQPGPLQVGIATAEITPEQPTYMRGFAGRNRPSEGTARPLLAQVVVFDNQQTRLAIVALDLCATSYRQLSKLRSAAAAVGVPEQHLMVNWSHSHYGPHLGSVEMNHHNVDYDAFFVERTQPLFAAAVADLQPALLDYTVGKSTMAINRRQVDDEGRVRGMRPEPRKPIDPDVPVLRVLTPEGEVRAVIFGYACHPTTTSGRMYYLNGTDFPGYARDWIQAAYPEAEAIFLQGCGGDIKPGAVRPSGGRDEAGRLNATIVLDEQGTKAAMGYELGRGVTRALAVQPPPVPADRPVELEEALAYPIPLGGIVELVDIPSKNDPERYTVTPFHMGAWRIGDVYIFASQGEVHSAIGLRIKRELADLRVWTNGYTHWGGGYVPETATYPEGGYEINVTAFAPGVEEIVVGNAHHFIEQLQADPVHAAPIPRCCP